MKYANRMQPYRYVQATINIIIMKDTNLMQPYRYVQATINLIGEHFLKTSTVITRDIETLPLSEIMQVIVGNSNVLIFNSQSVRGINQPHAHVLYCPSKLQTVI